MAQSTTFLPRRTLSRTAEVVGTGLFTGRPAILRMRSAPAGTDLVFRRSDLRESQATPDYIPAHISALAPQPAGIPARNTNLGAHPAGIITVEHILSAITGLGITDALLELDGPEVPIGDGSAAMFVEAIQRAGVQELDAGPEHALAPLTIDREITVRAGAAHITARPRQIPGCRYTYELDFGGGPIPAQSASFEIDHAPSETYIREIAPARTFCLEAEARAMRNMGLFTKLTPRDMLVFGDNGPIDNTLHFDNEPARHKLLDLIGDLALAGRPLQLDITAVRAGHSLNHELARALLAAQPSQP